MGPRPMKTSKLLIQRIFLILAFLSAGTALGQEVLVNRFKPDLPIYPQYFSVVQGAEGAVYLGHDQSVLRFDGSRWTPVELPTPGAVRALGRGADGRIWVGGTDSFGYLQRDATGADRLIDLTPRFSADLADEQFADVWRLLITEDTVYFVALHHLFALSLDGQRKGFWRHEGRFGQAVSMLGQTYVQWRGQGIKRLQDDGQFALIEDGEAFAEPLVRNLVPLTVDSALLHTIEPALYLWSPTAGAQKLALDQDYPIHQLTDARAVNENTVVFAGADGVVRVLDIAKGSFEQAQIAATFLNGPALADDGALLFSSNEGVLRLPWPASWTRYGSSGNSMGSVNKLARADDHLFALSATGVYRAPVQNGSLTRPFEFVPLVLHGEAWNLAPTRAGLVLAASHDLRLVTQDKTKTQRIGPDGLYPRVLLVTPEAKGTGAPEVLWTGNEHGLSAFTLQQGNWQMVDQVVQLGMQATSLVAAADGGVWLGTADYGLQRAALTFDPDPDLVLQAVPISSAQDEAADHSYAQVSNHGQGVLLSTPSGTFRLDGSRFVADDLGGLSDLKPDGEVVSFFDGVDGSLWAHSYRGLYRRRNGLWTVTDLATLNSGAIESVEQSPDGSLWIGGTSEVFHYLPELVERPGTGALALAALVRAADQGSPDQRLPLAGELQLQGRQLGVRAEFLMTDLEQAGSTVFRTRLLGLSDQWSPWGRSGQVIYPALEPGSYTLEAEARTGSGKLYQLLPRQFSVVPRWFESTWLRGVSIVAMFLLVMASVTALQRRQVKRLAARNAQLDIVVRQRTQELRAANKKLRNQAETDALTGVGNRRLFDQRLDECFDEANAEGGALALLMVDVDHFKRYNDTHGHQAGDWVLSKLASVLSDNVRGDTVVARYGGEEFAVIVPGCDNLSAARLARRLVGQVQSELGEVTISIGVAGYEPSKDSDPGSLVSRADDALYSAKRQGRNRFVLAA